MFQEKVSIRTARGTRKITKLDALVQKLMNDALTGDAKAVARSCALPRKPASRRPRAIEATSRTTEEDQIMERLMSPPR